MPELAIQLYTLRDIDRSVPDIIHSVGAAGYGGVEFAHRFHDADVDAVAAAMADAGVEAVGAHIGLDRLERADEALFDRYRAVGCSRLVIPHLPEAHFMSERAVTELADRLNALGADLDDRGFSLCYHNQDHEFHPEGDGTAFETLVDAVDADLVAFELDVGGAAAAGEDPAALLTGLGPRAPLVHVKDVHVENPTPGSGQVSADIGNGDVDVGAVADAAADAGVEWLVFEDDEPTDPELSLAAGYETLSTARV
jgi:sugar phosphate isomerase/epimerase